VVTGALRPAAICGKSNLDLLPVLRAKAVRIWQRMRAGSSVALLVLAKQARKAA